MPKKIQDQLLKVTEKLVKPILFLKEKRLGARLCAASHLRGKNNY